MSFLSKWNRFSAAVEANCGRFEIGVLSEPPSPAVGAKPRPRLVYMRSGDAMLQFTPKSAVKFARHLQKGKQRHFPEASHIDELADELIRCARECFEAKPGAVGHA